MTYKSCTIPWAFLSLTLFIPASYAQYRDQDRDRDRDRFTQIAPGTVIPVRLNQAIDVNRSDNRVFYGTIDADVRGENGRIAIPRGANTELMVRVARDNDLVLDMESVMVNGQRYAVRAEPDRVESSRDNSLVGQIFGAVTGAELRGPVVRIPRDAIVTFRLERPMQMGVADRGVDRDGFHYHDWYGHDRDHK